MKILKTIGIILGVIALFVICFRTWVLYTVYDRNYDYVAEYKIENSNYRYVDASDSSRGSMCGDIIIFLPDNKNKYIDSFRLCEDNVSVAKQEGDDLLFETSLGFYKKNIKTGRSSLEKKEFETEIVKIGDTEFVAGGSVGAIEKNSSIFFRKVVPEITKPLEE
ncbi:hypothetical protein HOB10_04785 [Candidatus Parcubacteria bacterium]|jgi:hypothetical protein|nr:hypothetical protein [Candidatus Parcubacteria bacterium]